MSVQETEKGKASPKRYNILKITNIKQFIRFILFFLKKIYLYLQQKETTCMFFLSFHNTTILKINNYGSKECYLRKYFSFFSICKCVGRLRSKHNILLKYNYQSFVFNQLRL